MLAGEREKKHKYKNKSRPTAEFCLQAALWRRYSGCNMRQVEVKLAEVRKQR